MKRLGQRPTGCRRRGRSRINRSLGAPGRARTGPSTGRWVAPESGWWVVGGAVARARAVSLGRESGV
eukprot:2353040-Prymnesium_polylepis.1